MESTSKSWQLTQNSWKHSTLKGQWNCHMSYRKRARALRIAHLLSSCRNTSDTIPKILILWLCEPAQLWTTIMKQTTNSFDFYWLRGVSRGRQTNKHRTTNTSCNVWLWMTQRSNNSTLHMGVSNLFVWLSYIVMFVVAKSYDFCNFWCREGRNDTKLHKNVSVLAVATNKVTK